MKTYLAICCSLKLFYFRLTNELQALNGFPEVKAKLCDFTQPVLLMSLATETMIERLVSWTVSFVHSYLFNAIAKRKEEEMIRSHVLNNIKAEI